MKKSVIALCLGSALFMAGCNDEQFAQKLLEAEKRIVQLQADYQQSQTQLAQTESELAKLQQLNAEAENSEKAFPALQPDIVEVFSRRSIIKHPKDPKDKYAPEETHVSVFASTAKTCIEWLDRELLLSLLGEQGFFGMDGLDSVMLFAQARSYFEHFFEEQEALAKADNDRTHLSAHSINTFYVGQRKNIVTFERITYYYTGGAHGMYDTEYLNFDINKKALIGLNDLIDPKNQDKVREMLLNQYRTKVTDENGEFVGLTSEEDFFIPQQFYFTPEGIQFVFPLGKFIAYSEGEMSLLLTFYEVNELLNPEYQLTKKDGFGLDTTP